jgi:hypothetical protein
MEYFVSIEIAGNFVDNRSVNLRDFLSGFSLIENVVKMADGIPSELKDYRVDKLLEDLHSLRQLIPETEEGLADLYKKRAAMEFDLPVRRVDGFFAACKEYPREKNKELKNARVFCSFESDLSPHLSMYAHIFGAVLKNEAIQTPGYTEIHFSIEQTMDDAKRNHPLDTRTGYKYTYSTIDKDKYAAADTEEKERLVFESFASGLGLIADIDHLDKEKTELVVSRVKEDGTRIELIFLAKENKTHRAEVVYTIVADPVHAIPFYLKITEKSGEQRSAKMLIDHLDMWTAGYAITTLTFKKEEVTIKGKAGQRGQYVFSIAEMFK